MDNMENSAIRTELDTIINAFLLSELSAELFISENLSELKDKSDKIERISSFMKYLKGNNQESLLQHFYEEQLQAIPIDVNEFEIQKMDQLETIEYLEILREEAFNRRVQELEILRKEVLPKYIEYYQMNNSDIDTIEDNELIGLNYYITNNDSELDALFDFLIHEKLIEKVDKRMFKLLFREKFDKYSPKIHFTGSASLFASMIKKMMSLKKEEIKIFQHKGKSYHYILDNVFEKVKSKSGMKKPSEILNTNYLSKKDKLIFIKFSDFLKVNFKPDEN